MIFLNVGNLILFKKVLEIELNDCIWLFFLLVIYRVWFVWFKVRLWGIKNELGVREFGKIEILVDEIFVCILVIFFKFFFF